MSKKKIINSLFILGLVFYIGFVLWNIPFKYVSPLDLFSSDRYFSRTLNLIPFNEVFKGNFNKLDIFGNMILFIPLGIYINILIKDIKVFKSICIMIIISFIFECSQFIFGIGASDITDIITNTMGGIIGICIYMVIKMIFRDNTRVKNFIIICSMGVMLPVTTLLIGLFIAN
jgi:glycopeptide antibiotics resistance protein